MEAIWIPVATQAFIIGVWIVVTLATTVLHL